MQVVGQKQSISNRIDGHRSSSRDSKDGSKKTVVIHSKIPVSNEVGSVLIDETSQFV